jgi:hypothetical protein
MAGCILHRHTTFTYKNLEATSYTRIRHTLILPTRVSAHNAVIETNNVTTSKETKMNVQQLNSMNINHTLPHGLMYAADPEDFEVRHFSAKAIHDDLDWEEYVSSDISTEFGDTIFDSSSY